MIIYSSIVTGIGQLILLEDQRQHIKIIPKIIVIYSQYPAFRGIHTTSGDGE